MNDKKIEISIEQTDVLLKNEVNNIIDCANNIYKCELDVFEVYKGQVILALSECKKLIKYKESR